MPVVAAADIRRSCTECLVAGCCKIAHRLLNKDPTRSATSAAFPLASFATPPTKVPADCPASFSFTPAMYCYWIENMTIRTAREQTKKNIFIYVLKRVPDEEKKPLAFSCHWEELTEGIEPTMRPESV